MLSVPESIKTLLKRDNVLKNLRVSFPNGDHADIRNDQIIRESMRFEETLCSRTPLKFGLCEANLISFNCYGVENIKRKVISVRIEVDISSLSAAEQAQYGQTSDDVPFVFYPISYGNFIVTECERDADINLRKIVAASVGLMDNEDISVSMNNACEYDKKKLFYFTYSSSKEKDFDNVLYLLLQGQDIFDPDYVGHTIPADISDEISDTVYHQGYYDIRKTTGQTSLYSSIVVSYIISTRAVQLQSGASDPVPYSIMDLTRLKTAEGYDSEAIEYINEVLDFMHSICDYDYFKITGKNRGKDSWNALEELLYKCMFTCLLARYWNASDNKHNPALTERSTDVWFDSGAYVPMNQYVHSMDEIALIPIKFRVRVYRAGTYIYDEQFVKNANAHKYMTFHWGVTTFLSRSIRQVTTEKVKIGNTTRYSPTIPIAEINVKNFLQDRLELMGMFGGLGRNGVFREYSLLMDDLFPAEDLYPADDLYPSNEDNDTNINRSEYIRCVYEEDYFYYKGIYVSYKDTNDEDAEYQVLFNADDDNPDMPYYDLSQNSIIQSQTYTEEQIIELIQDLIDVLRLFRYYKVDLDMRALPYVEIGDIVYLHTPEETINFPVLSNRITGIQDLRANLKAQ